MNNQSSLSYINELIPKFQVKFQEQIDHHGVNLPVINGNKKVIMYMSIGNPEIRAKVEHVIANTMDRAFSKLLDKAIELVRKQYVDPTWLKFDLVTDVEEVAFKNLEEKVRKTRRYYFRDGIALDPEFRISFLEQEINGNVMIRRDHRDVLQLHEKHINNYMKQRFPKALPFIHMRYRQLNPPVYLFKTKSFFVDREDKIIHELLDGELTNGIRKVDNIQEELTSVVDTAASFLKEQLQDDHTYIYGYFAAFGRPIDTYNILRHLSTTYSMLEAYELTGDETLIETSEKAFDYALEHAIVYKDDCAYVVDHTNEQEIKLGALGAAVLAMAKYMQVTKTTKYLEVAQSLARGILSMKNMDEEGFVHVLQYPDFSVKDRFRIVYYDGEAVFSLIRLYQIDQDERWLDVAKQSMDHFIATDHWKHHDHWLSYAANEITDFVPEDKYFIFGMKNCQNRLNFIYHRDTTYPTFLEMTMAAYKLVQKIKELKKDYLLDFIDDELLTNTVDKRAEYQRVGVFYPEVAMYVKHPALVVGGCFVRHHTYRTRIDEIAHYISGFTQYITARIPDKENERPYELIK